MVRDYSFKDYDLNFIKGEHWETHPEKNLFIGFELEVEFPLSNEGEMNDISDYIEYKYDEILCCKWDSSLNNGFEFISHPIHVELYENGYMESVLNKLLGDLSKYGGVVSSTTGLHFHVSRKGFSRNGFSRRILCLMTNFREELMKHSGRYDYRLEGDGERSRFNYCQFPALTLSNINTNELAITRGHRTALNCGNDDTIEFRFFAATLSVKDFLKRVSIVINLVRAGNNESVHNVSIKTIIPGYRGKDKFSIDLAQVHIDMDNFRDTVNKFIDKNNDLINKINISIMHEFANDPYMVKQLFGILDGNPYYNPRIPFINNTYTVKCFDLSLYDYASSIVDILQNRKFYRYCEEISMTDEYRTKLNKIIEKIKKLEKVKVDIWKMIK